MRSARREWKGPLIYFPRHYVPRRDEIWQAGKALAERVHCPPICLWEAYQAEQSYENCCRWLKHRAWMKLEGCE